MELNLEKIKLNLPEEVKAEAELFSKEIDRLVACDHNYVHNWEYRSLILLKNFFQGLKGTYRKSAMNFY